LKILREHKWLINWTAFAAMVGLFVFVAIYFNNKNWLSNALQTIGTITGIYLTIIVFLQSKEASDKQFQNQLNHLQRLNAAQIEALRESTDKQISALQELTEKQIEALHKITFEQITSFEHQTSEVTTKLSDNSILLAEILGRELEKSIDIFTNAVNQEEARFNDLSSWKPFRTKEEKEQQLKNSWNRIQYIKRGLDYLNSKYEKVREFLGFGQRQLKG
jgi:hypothetical protein